MSLTAEEERLVDQGFHRAMTLLAAGAAQGIKTEEFGPPRIADAVFSRLRANGINVEIRAPKDRSMFFLRGDGPLVSVLLPTRNRSHSLLDSIDSLYSLAADKNIEFIFKIDEDDPDTAAACEAIGEHIPIKFVLSPQGGGYRDMHLWHSQMASIATGDWLLLWNDDARMRTDRWDELLLYLAIDEKSGWHGVRDVLVVMCDTIGRPLSCEFLFVRKKVFDIIGHLSTNPHTDNWLITIMTFLGCAFRIPIEIEHLSDGLTDKVRTDVLTAYRESGRDFNSMEQVSQRIEDVRKLMAYISAEQQKMKQSPVSI